MLYKYKLLFYPKPESESIIDSELPYREFFPDMSSLDFSLSLDKVDHILNTSGLCLSFLLSKTQSHSVSNLSLCFTLSVCLNSDSSRN